MPPAGHRLVDLSTIGRQNAPAAFEQRSKARCRAGLLGAGDRMSADKVNIVGHVRRHGFDDPGLDRPDIGDDRTGLQMRADFGSHLAACPDRHTDNHQIRIAHCIGRRLMNRVDQVKLHRHAPGFSTARMARYMPCQAFAPYHMAER